MKKRITIDFDAVYCNPAHLTATGRGWARRLRELGGDEAEANSLMLRLRSGKAAQIELERIYRLAGIHDDD